MVQMRADALQMPASDKVAVALQIGTARDQTFTARIQAAVMVNGARPMEMVIVIAVGPRCGYTGEQNSNYRWDYQHLAYSLHQLHPPIELCVSDGSRVRIVLPKKAGIVNKKD
jgi:hypothetical protein